MRAVGNTFVTLTSITLLATSMSLTGCQTFKNLTGKNKEAIETAEKSEQGYYQAAIEQINKGNYLQAVEDLGSLRTFYPTGRFAEQALLDMMYAQFEGGEYEAAASSAELFIRLYPSNPQVSYAYYVRGVANMQGTTDAFRLFKLNQAERDTAYLRLAFANFQELINKYPNSPYAPDAAQRMIYIYNQFAESELAAANWYIEREAYVAAANRAKWVFQYYPRSESIPEAIAILAYSNQQLGLTDLANDYKTLLQLNYPQWLTPQGQVRLNTNRDRSWLNKISFGKLGRQSSTASGAVPSYTGETKTQEIRQAIQLQLPDSDTSNNSRSSNTGLTLNQGRRGINIGLGLPQSDTEQVTSQSSASQAAIDAQTESQNSQRLRRTTPLNTLSNDNEATGNPNANNSNRSNMNNNIDNNRPSIALPDRLPDLTNLPNDNQLDYGNGNNNDNSSGQ